MNQLEVFTDGIGQLGMVVFDRENVVAAITMNLLSNRLLGSDCIERDNGATDINEV